MYVLSAGRNQRTNERVAARTSRRKRRQWRQAANTLRSKATPSLGLIWKSLRVLSTCDDNELETGRTLNLRSREYSSDTFVYMALRENFQ